MPFWMSVKMLQKTWVWFRMVLACTERRDVDDETSSNEIRDSSPEDGFKHDVFYALLDCVIGNMARSFEAA